MKETSYSYIQTAVIKKACLSNDFPDCISVYPEVNQASWIHSSKKPLLLTVTTTSCNVFNRMFQVYPKGNEHFRATVLISCRQVQVINKSLSCTIREKQGKR